MKRLSRLIACTFLGAALFFSAGASAQTTPANKFTFGLGLETGVPTGDASLGATFTLGATGRFQYGITDRVAVTFAAGGYHFFPKLAPGTSIRYPSYGEIPIKGGIKGFVTKNIYLMGEAGVAWEKLQSGWGPHRLDLSPTVGYANEHWDFGLHYERFTRTNESLGLVNLRLAYGFGL